MYKHAPNLYKVDHFLYKVAPKVNNVGRFRRKYGQKVVSKLIWPEVGPPAPGPGSPLSFFAMPTFIRYDYFKAGELKIPPADFYGTTTNGVVSKFGSLVMGAGHAKAINTQFKVARALGHKIERNHEYYKILPDGFVYRYGLATVGNVLAFQTKLDWHRQSTIDLIEESAAKLMDWTYNQGFPVVYLPLPGCGLGGLRRKDVEPLLLQLPDNVYIFYK